MTVSDTDMQVFNLLRLIDESGVSGQGHVAQGVQFDNGWCALTWLTEKTSVAFYPDIQTLIDIHGHNGNTQIQYIPIMTPAKRARIEARRTRK